MEQNNIKSKININKIIEIVMTIVCLIWIIMVMKPIIEITKYSHSSTDDYWMTLSVHKIWEETHSIFKAIAEAFRCTVSQYLYHDGCFVSMFMLTLSPVAFNEKYYKFTGYLVIIFLMIAVYFASYIFFRKKLKFSWLSTTTVGSMILYLLINYLPSAGEGLYWWPGAANYTFFFSLSVILQAIVILYITDKKTVWLVLSAIIAIFSCQGNLLTALTSTCLLFLEWLYLVKRDGIKKNYFSIVVVLSIASLLISVFAPGNFIRGADDVKNSSVVMTVIDSIKNGTIMFFTLQNIKIWVLYVFIGIIAFLSFMNSETTFKFRFPGVFFVFAYLLYCASLAPVEFTKIPYYSRVLDVMYYHIILAMTCSIIYFAGYISRVVKEKKKLENKLINTSILSAAIILMIVFVGLFKFGSTSATAKLFIDNGDAERFDKRIMDRFVLFYDDNVREVYFDCEDSVPSIFFYSDIDTMNEKAFFIENGTRVVADYFYLEDKNAVFEDLKYINLIAYYFNKDKVIMNVK